MNNLASSHSIRGKNLYRFSIFIFVSILVFNGTYFRIRPAVDVPTMDWLVFTRLLTCSIGFIVAIFLIPKSTSWGFGAKVLCLYLLFSMTSAINSPYPKAVVGYVILVFGSSALMLALVYSAQNVMQLEKIETIWLITIGALILKDSITGLFFSEIQSDTEIIRLGMEVTHPNQLSMLAAVAFWISFRKEKVKKLIVLWQFRSFLLFVILSAVSRVSIAAFLIGGLFYFFTKRNGDSNRSVFFLCCLGFLVSFFILTFSFGHPWTNNVISYLRRGQNETELASITGRTVIWKHAFNKSIESPVIGHGYGLSRLTMGPLPSSAFRASHCHNEILETFLNTGLLGLVFFVLMILYSSKWIKDFSKLRESFSANLAVHGICVIVMLFVSFSFETKISGKVSPIQTLFFFYLLTIDREKYFSALGKRAGENRYG